MSLLGRFVGRLKRKEQILPVKEIEKKIEKNAEKIEKNVIQSIEAPKTDYLLMETMDTLPTSRGFMTTIKNGFVEASVKGLSAGLLAFFETLSKSIRNGRR